jgi:DNA polymerase IV (DinB-like DNA polymerase)
LTRVVGHVDLDYFYAQVEEVEDPSLKGRPVVVCVFSGRTEDSGAVATANYRARELGVHSGIPIVLAKKKLEGSNPAIIKMDHPKYEAISARIMEQLEGMVDVLEPTGIDEAFFDLSASTEGDYSRARKSAEAIKESVLTSERLTCSVGIGRSKVVAKLGSDSSKPNGLTVVTPKDTEAFLFPLPIGKLYGVGPKTQSALEGLGIKTVGQLAKMDPLELEGHLGKKFGDYLIAAARGEDPEPVVAGLEPTQFSRIVTLKRDTRDPNEVMDQLSGGIDYVQGKLNASGKSFRTVSAIAVLTDLSLKTKSKTFETPVSGANTIREAALSLFAELRGTSPKEFRRVGVRVSSLSGVQDQSSLSEFIHPVKAED